MIIVTNFKIDQVLRDCERLIENGSERLIKRKYIQQGINEINQGIGGLRVVRGLIGSSQEAKTFSINY